MQDDPDSTASSSSHNALAGAAIPPIPLNLIEKIESGAFIEMSYLLPSRIGLDDATKAKQKHRFVTTITEWLQGFAVYVSVISQKQPQRIPDLMGYQVLILEASTEYKNDCWMGYNRRFRQQAASQRSWSCIDSTLWTLAFSGQARGNRCKHCFSLSHTSRECELAPDTPVGQSPSSQYIYRGQRYNYQSPNSMRSSQQYNRKQICYQWNEIRSQTCPHPNCRYSHVCYICAPNPEAKDIKHKAIFCPHRYNHRPSTSIPPLMPPDN